MPDFLQFTLFPPGALQSSVITTVWVGVFVVVFLNARFGTTLAGLVVPGYLVPLFFVKPASAIVVLVEAYMTYGLAWLLANKLLVRFGYSEMFGRDRFFALILLSVLVRIAMDFFAIPALIDVSGELFAGYDLKNNLQSFGLIIVALIANQMWMGGITKGSKALFMYLGLTFLIIQWLLIPLTNFNIGGLNYMYEDLATSLLSSPKAYIILITTAFIASRMNLQFGWEFNGILIPALLALQWYQPEKLLFTFVEATVVLFLGIMVMRIPWFKGTTFEGGRLILLFFNIGFVYKILLGFALIEFLPSAKISDYFGFGYIVSTLIAVKVYQKKIAVKMAVSTVFTSFVGITFATIVGFLLTFTTQDANQQQAASVSRDVTLTSETVQSVYAQIRPASFFSTVRPTDVSKEQAVEFEKMMQIAQSVNADNVHDSLTLLADMADAIEIDIWVTQDNVLLFHRLGIGFYAVRLQPKSNIILEVTRARAELGAATLGLAMFEKLQNKAVFVDLSYQLQSSGEYIFDSTLENGMFQSAHRVFSEHNVLQIRGDLKITEQRKRLRRNEETSQNFLRVLRTLPEDLPVELLDSVVSELTYEWQESAINPQWQDDKFGIAELTLNNREMRSALARLEVYQEETDNNSVQDFEGYLISWLLERKDLIAKKGDNGYQIPSENELLYWHQDILVPLMTWLKQFEQSGWNQQTRNELQRLNLQAGSVGYQFRVLQQPLSQREFLLLEEQPDIDDTSQRRNWATLVVNLTAQNDFLIQVPNPFFERTSFEFGAALFSKLQNRFLLLSGAHPWANTDGSSNVTLAGNNRTLFHTMFMAITKEFEQQQVIPIQIRGFSFQESRPFPKELSMVSLWRNINQYDMGEQTQFLISQLEDFGLSYRYVNGDFVTSPYYQSTNQQIDYLNYLKLDEFVTLWISPLVRDSFKATEVIKIEEQHARLMQLPVYRRDLQSFSVLANVVIPEFATIESQLGLYAKNRNVHHLNKAIDVLRRDDSSHTLAYLLDSASLQQFILVIDTNERLIGAINLNSLNQRELSTSQADSVTKFVDSRYLWLLPENEDKKP